MLREELQTLPIPTQLERIEYCRSADFFDVQAEKLESPSNSKTS